MFRKGYVGAGVRDIVAEAPAPQGSFTNHFRSKEEFAREVLDRYFDDLKRLVAETLGDRSRSPCRRLKRYLDLISDRLAKAEFSRGCLIGDFSLEAAPQSERLRLRLAEIFAEWRALRRLHRGGPGGGRDRFQICARRTCGIPAVFVGGRDPANESRAERRAARSASSTLSLPPCSRSPDAPMSTKSKAGDIPSPSWATRFTHLPAEAWPRRTAAVKRPMALRRSAPALRVTASIRRCDGLSKSFGERPCRPAVHESCWKPKRLIRAEGSRCAERPALAAPGSKSAG